MVLRTAMKKIMAKYGDTPAAVLSDDESTGQQPLELFITDEHTEHYLSLNVGSDRNRGMLSGLLGEFQL